MEKFEDELAPKIKFLQRIEDLDGKRALLWLNFPESPKEISFFVST